MTCRTHYCPISGRRIEGATLRWIGRVLCVALLLMGRSSEAPAQTDPMLAVANFYSILIPASSASLIRSLETGAGESSDREKLVQTQQKSVFKEPGARRLSLSFATVQQGKKILEARDEFVERLSPFDRSSRMKTDREVSEAEFTRFVAENVLEWTDPERDSIRAAAATFQGELDELYLEWPETIQLVKTTGHEEGQAAYTRGTAIVLPRNKLGEPNSLRALLAHELFHVLSRSQPDLRDQLYAAIGFHKCQELPFPSALKAKRITNPDGPRNEHCIQVQLGERTVWAIPILYSNQLAYDPLKGGEFFSYLEFRFLIVHRDTSETPSLVTYNDSSPELVEPSKIAGFFEQVGRNTRYILHPDEILADNFKILICGGEEVKSPEILERIRTVLKDGSGRGRKPEKK